MVASCIHKWPMENELLKEIEDYLVLHDVTPSRFGRDVMRNPNFVFILREGGDYTSKTARRVRDYMKERESVS